MKHRYFPHTAEDIDRMLEVCKVGSLDELYADVPEQLRLARPYNLPEELSEKEVRDFFKALAQENHSDLTCFAGAGYYDHYSPSAVASIAARSEFLTSYTPYQPEISQGTLQYIFEYQTMICRLTGMEISNASMYDGATATAEAMLLAASNNRKRHRILYSTALNPDTKAVLLTYARYHGVPVTELPEVEGVTSIEALKSDLAVGDVAGVILATPNYHGILEDFTGVAEAVHAAGALLIMNCIAIDLATVRTPGEWGADIAVGDAQSLGIPLNFGGPYLGFMAASKSLMRKLPGRIVGATKDDLGNRVFVLTLQAREQHIRREKATSNICSNQGLMALYVTIYMSLMGDKGLDEVNRRGAAGAHYLATRLAATGKMRLAYPDAPFLNEFEMVCDSDIDLLLDRLAEVGILGGVKTPSGNLLVAVTEMQTVADLDRYVDIVNQL